MQTSNKSFWELITEYKINIPIIQRDYAQGREEEFEKRSKFLNSLYKSLTGTEILDLDFVYGRIKGNIFYPIDGQQRLTTLFLLHWYIALKENVGETQKQYLLRFVYDTRITSREFCKSLVSENVDLPTDVGNNKFIDAITDKYWFRNSWQTDPTIKAMLIMIQAIHDKFYHTQNISLWNNIIEGRLISFQTLDLGAKGFELTDELYIKMNARGKQLTPFENFKANFIQFIERNFKDRTLKHPVKGFISYSGYFSYKIEKEWTDLFWAYRGDKSTIDAEIANYFEFIAQMCFFRSNRNARADDFNKSFTQYETIFKQEENLLFLFNSLDKLYAIYTDSGAGDKGNVSRFFDSFITLQPLEDVSEKVALFWVLSGSSDLFERMIKNVGSEDARTKIIFYSVIHYLLKQDISTNRGVTGYVRTLRNLIQATRQRNETKYNTNIRLNNFGSYWMLFEQLASADVYYTLAHATLDNKGTQISDSSLNNEKQKAEILLLHNDTSEAILSLEGFTYFEGLIHILKPKRHQNKLINYRRVLTEIWDHSIPDSIKIQALIACGFEGIEIREKTSMKGGGTYYFGKAGNWTAILTNEDVEVSNCLISLLDSYLLQNGDSAKSKLQSIISDWLKANPNDKTWKYYFLSYPAFMSGRNYYVWPNDFEISILGSESSNPLVAYHISPYVRTVCKLINDTTICDVHDCYIQYSGNSSLMLKNGISMTCLSKGWLISGELDKLNNEIISQHGLLHDGDNYLLKEPDTKDRIQIAVEFIRLLYSNTTNV